MVSVKDIVSMVPGSPEYGGIRNRALSGDVDALELYTWWALWKTIKEDKRFTRPQALSHLKALVSTIKFKVTLDG